jgi:hypothetical protein
MITGFVACFIEMSIQKQDAKKDKDLLQFPQRKEIWQDCCFCYSDAVVL